MRSTTRRLLGVVLFLASLIATNSPHVAAAGLVVTPAFSRISIPQDQPEQFASFVIKNDTTARVQLTAQASDVDISSNDLRPTGQQKTSATKSLEIINPTLQLQSQQSVNLIVRINGASVAAGGHYTSLLIKEAAPKGSKAVPITRAVSIGLYIVKEAGAVRSLVLDGPLLRGIHFSPPKSFELSLRAAGNVAVVPHAAVQVFEGKEVIASATINPEGSVLLPDARRIDAVEWQYQKPLSPGRHTVQVTYRYDAQEKPAVVTATFWYIPVWYGLFFVGGLAAFFWYTRRYFKPLTDHVSAMIAPEKLPEIVVHPEPETPVVAPPEKAPKKAFKKTTTQKTKKPRKKVAKKSK